MNYEDRVTKEYIENAIANAGSKIVVGTYTGDGEPSQFIDLGATPKAVYVCKTSDGTNQAWSTTNRFYYGGLVLEGHPISIQSMTILQIEAGGLRVYYSSDTSTSTRYFVQTNNANVNYSYVAIF